MQAKYINDAPCPEGTTRTQQQQESLLAVAGAMDTVCQCEQILSRDGTTPPCISMHAAAEGLNLKLSIATLAVLLAHYSYVQMKGKGMRKVTSDTVAHYSIFCLFVVNIVLP